MPTFSDFFKDSVIFITGATGYLGKVLVEKLLRSCGDLQAVYILIRVKKGQSSEIRFQEYCKDQVFEELRFKNLSVLQKLKLIPGDLSLPNLGLSNEYHQLLIENVNFVINSAAIVKFMAPLADSATLNVLGTENVLELSSKMLKLRSFVHVSTAFCTLPQKDVIGEKVYPIETISIESFLLLLKTSPEGIINRMSDVLTEPYGTTYTFTKAIAEQLVLDYSKKLPICIVRCSYLGASAVEPFPGFIDSTQAISLLLVCGSRGPTISMLCNPNVPFDNVPVDFAAKAILASIKETAQNRTFKIYNCVSSGLNPITMRQYMNIFNKWLPYYPTKLNIAYPYIYGTSNFFLYYMNYVFFQLLPAYILDMLQQLKGSETIFVSLCKRFDTMLRQVNWALFRNWEYETENMKILIEKTKEMEDGDDFNFDMRTLNWETYAEKYVMGIRRYLLLNVDKAKL